MLIVIFLPIYINLLYLVCIFKLFFFELLYSNLTGSRKICDKAILQMMNLMRTVCTNALTVNFYVLLIMSIMSESTYSNNLIRISQSWTALANLIGYSCFCYSLMLISSGKSLESPQCC